MPATSSSRSSAFARILVAAILLGSSLAAASTGDVRAGVTQFDKEELLAIPNDGYDGTLASMAASTIDTSPELAGHRVNDVYVMVEITHEWVGDLTIKLRGPTGSVLTLLERPQGDNFQNPCCDDGGSDGGGDDSTLDENDQIWFADTYTVDAEQIGLGVDMGEPACDFSCNFQPNPDNATGPLSLRDAFGGQPAGGDWTLYVGDSSGSFEGSLYSWSIFFKHYAALHSCDVGPFPDVPVAHPFCREIQWMKESDVSTGFMDGTYRPDAVVTRQAMAAFMARVADAFLQACSTPPFPDVPTDHPFCREIRWTKQSGISTGFGDGTYRPGTAVTRQAMSAFLARLAQSTLAPCTSAPFPDVPTSHPFCAEIKWMEAAGISTGFGDGTYRPSAAVTRQAMSAFLQRVSPLMR